MKRYKDDNAKEADWEYDEINGILTVGELIGILKEAPQDADVLLGRSRARCDGPIGHISVRQGIVGIFTESELSDIDL